MKQGIITISFTNTTTHHISVTVPSDADLKDSTAWRQLLKWWTHPAAAPTTVIRLDDGGVLMLKHDTVSAISLTPKPVLEI